MTEYMYDASDVEIPPVTGENIQYVVLYDDTPPPAWWRPIKRWKFRKHQVVAWWRYE